MWSNKIDWNPIEHGLSYILEWPITRYFTCFHGELIEISNKMLNVVCGEYTIGRNYMSCPMQVQIQNIDYV